MKILDRLPISDEPALIEVRGEVYQVWKNQAIVRVGLDESLAPFPAILDTGHSRNLSITRCHIQRWAPRDLQPIGQAKIAGHLVPRYASDLFVHRNRPVKRKLAGACRHSRPADRTGLAAGPEPAEIGPAGSPVGGTGVIHHRPVLALVVADGDRARPPPLGWPGPMGDSSPAQPPSPAPSASMARPPLLPIGSGPPRPGHAG